jgi:hypothetical protein
VVLIAESLARAILVEARGPFLPPPSCARLGLRVHAPITGRCPPGE